MVSFFGSIQNWFSADVYGRHLGLILQEVGTRRPNTLTSFLSRTFGISHKDLRNARFEAEYSFRGQNGWRRADLAVFRADDDEPVVLVEIKYHDKPLPETDLKPAQLADYRVWRNRFDSKRHVLVLSRELYRAEDLVVCRWDALTRHLRPFAEESDLVDMLVKYLEEEGNAMQEINGSSLIRYLKRLVCHGEFGANNVNGPAEFSSLLKNMQLTSGVFHGHFKAAWRMAGEKVHGENGVRRSKAASIDFSVWNRVKPTRSARPAVDENGWFENRLRNGGHVSAFARHALGHARDWLRVSYGVRFDVSPGDSVDTVPTTYLWAEIRGAKLRSADARVWKEHKINFKWVTDDAESAAGKVESRFNLLLLAVIDQALNSGVRFLPQQRKALKLLQQSLSSGLQPLLNGN
ncbi:hypothetical protein [Achromobacter sp. UMC71]|uniref:hypothetical protein n=1 Tax=Achromobacter sp. UMC71 TaxID=1862320 RepID=UPI0016029028|nr:hypothetical protein [Achromobacter sp. UMC71]